MSARTDAFVTVSCKCPICEREVTNRYVKSNMYQPVEVEDDRFVKKYRWELDQYKRLRPEYYHVWHCPYCHFCEEKEVFRGEDNLDGKLEMLQDKLLIESRRPDSMMVQLGELIDLQSGFVSWSSALAAHMLAIYIQNQLSPNMRLNGKLARLYLRTAWLYREKRYPEMAAGREPDDPELIQVLNDLKAEWPDGPYDEDVAMQKAIEYYKLELENAGRLDNIRLEVSIMFLLISLYLRLDDKRTAYSYVRMIFRGCTKRRGTTQKALEGAARRDNVTGKQIERIKSLLQWLNNTVERASTMAEDLTEAIFRDEYPKARESVLEIEGEPTPEAVLEHLREAGFFEGTCRRVATIYKKKLIQTDLESLEEAEAAADRAAREEKNRGFFSKVFGRIKGEEEE